MKMLLLFVVIVLAGYVWFVGMPKAKCAGIAHDRNAAYSFSAARGCEIRGNNLTWLLTPNYLRSYER